MHCDSTRSSYDRFAASYTCLYFETRALDREMDRFREYLPAQPAVLDAGCGPGHLGAYLESRGVRVFGLDYSIAMLREGRSKGVVMPFVQADLRALPFHDSTFDGIWARASLLHLDLTDHRRALHEIHRLLRIGGIFYAAVREGQGSVSRRETQQDVSLERYFAFWRRADWLGELERAGYRILEEGTEDGSPESWLYAYAIKG